MALILNGTTGITVTDGSNILQDGTVTTDDLAAGAVTSAKMAAGAAATNLGNYVQSFNGSTGAVSYTAPVTSVNGSTGAVTVQATLVSGSNIKTINSTSLLGSGDITVGASTSFNDIGTYVNAILFPSDAGTISYGSTVSAGSGGNQIRVATIYQDNNGVWYMGWTNSVITGTWRLMGATKSGGNSGYMWYSIYVRVS